MVSVMTFWLFLILFLLTLFVFWSMWTAMRSLDDDEGGDDW